MARVLISGYCAVPGPRRAGVQVRHVIRALNPTHAVDLLVVREGDQPYVERHGAVRVLRVPTHDQDPWAQIQAFQRALRRQLDGADYDIVHCRDAWSGSTVLEVRARLGFAMVFDLSRGPELDEDSTSEVDARYSRDELACITGADLVLVPTPAAAKHVRGLTKPERVALAPVGVDVDRFDWDLPPTEGPPRVLYVGAIAPGRGVRVLVRAMADVVKRTEAHLVLAGPISPAFEAELRTGIRELKLEGKVHTTGTVDHDEVPALIASATVCVAPSGHDLVPVPTAIAPTKIFEYMACRRAVIAARRQTISSVMEHGRDGLLFEANDPTDLGRKIHRLLVETPFRERLAAAGYARVRNEFTASAARRSLRVAYDALSRRFAGQFAPVVSAAEPPRSPVLLTDDEFEATVFEDLAPAEPADTGSIGGLGLGLDEALISLDNDVNDGTGSSPVVAPPAPAMGEETAERPLPPPPLANSGSWTRRTPSQPPRHEWSAAGSPPARPESDDDGTPVEGVRMSTPMMSSESSFVAGEIDVPSPSAKSLLREFSSGLRNSDSESDGKTPPHT
ncbi:MAG: glycosyltransferase family 4 protein [Kofleriaceae bacterium]